MQVKLSPSAQTGDLGMRSKCQIALYLHYKVNFKVFLIPNLYVFPRIKYIKHIEWNFHSVAWVIPQGWDFGVLWVKNFSVGICDGAPSTARF